MRNLQGIKYTALVSPQAIMDNVSPTVTYVDTKGTDSTKIVVMLGALDIAMVTLKITESDSSGSGYTDVTGLVFGTSTQISGSASTLPSATDDNKFYIFDIDNKGRKRYLKPAITVGDGAAGTYLACWAESSLCETVPVTAAECGAGQILRV